MLVHPGLNVGVGLWEEFLDCTILQINTFPSPVQVKRFFLQLGRSLKLWSYLKFQLFLWLVTVLSRISDFTNYANYKINRQLLVSLIKQPIRFDKIQSSTFSVMPPTTRNCFSRKLKVIWLMQGFICVGGGAISIFGC